VSGDGIPHGTLSGYSYHRCRCDECRAVKTAKVRANFERNREKVKAKSRDWAAANAERRRQTNKAYRAANAEVIAARKREYYETPPRGNC